MSEEFQNSSYFILPLKIDNFDRLMAFLRSEESKWKEQDGFKTNFLMYYAGKMNEPADDRFRIYRYTEKENLYIYYGGKAADPGKGPTLGDISLYVSGKEISFLEFQVFYGDMSVDEIASFVYSFRRLRKLRKLLGQTDCNNQKDAVEDILPAEKSGVDFCFSNLSDIKKQANIFTILNIPGLSDEDSRNKCGRIAHGYKTVAPSDVDAASAYDKCLHLNAIEYWGICPDGLAYINNTSKEKLFSYAYDYLCNDYHLMYLLLLIQRFTAISFIETISQFGRTDKASPEIEDVYRRVVDLRTKYSFRVISDDFFVQTVYSTAYQILEIDALLKDLEDANGQFNELSRVREKRVEQFVIAVSLLAAFSAVADLAAFLGLFPWNISGIISIVFVIIILAGAFLGIFKPWKRRQ